MNNILHNNNKTILDFSKNNFPAFLKLCIKYMCTFGLTIYPFLISFLVETSIKKNATEYKLMQKTV